MAIQIISTLRDRTPVPQQKPLVDAQVIWGGPSNFSWGSAQQNFNSDPTVRFNSDIPDDPEGDEVVRQPITYNWREVSRRESTVRIDGPDGAYVDFSRIDEVTFRLPDQDDGTPVYVVQTFNNNSPTATASTSTGPITAKWVIVPKST